MPDKLSVLSISELQEIIGPHCNPYLTIAVSRTANEEFLNFSVTDISDGAPHQRVLSAVEYLSFLYKITPKNSNIHAREFNFIFQAEDVPVDVASVSWESQSNWENIKVIPDLYYFTSRGYEGSFVGDMKWKDRQNRIIWRGSTTGLFYQKLQDLDRLPRYQLCSAMARLGDIADVGFTAVVQAFDDQEEAAIRDRLIREDLFRPFIPMSDMAQCRYVLDIDGNSNSWNFIEKMRLGCCLLRVESDWRQWFWPRMRPWVHYVPIAGDLSDLGEIVRWCLAHEAECEAIANQGLEFGKSMRFDDEMAEAASRAFL